MWGPKDVAVPNRPPRGWSSYVESLGKGTANGRVLVKVGAPLCDAGHLEPFGEGSREVVTGPGVDIVVGIFEAPRRHPKHAVARPEVKGTLEERRVAGL